MWFECCLCCSWKSRDGKLDLYKLELKLEGGSVGQASSSACAWSAALHSVCEQGDEQEQVVQLLHHSWIPVLAVPFHL